MLNTVAHCSFTSPQLQRSTVRYICISFALISKSTCLTCPVAACSTLQPSPAFQLSLESISIFGYIVFATWQFTIAPIDFRNITEKGSARKSCVSSSFENRDCVISADVAVTLVVVFVHAVASEDLTLSITRSTHSALACSIWKPPVATLVSRAAATRTSVSVG